MVARPGWKHWLLSTKAEMATRDLGDLDLGVCGSCMGLADDWVQQQWFNSCSYGLAIHIGEVIAMPRKYQRKCNSDP